MALFSLLGAGGQVMANAAGTRGSASYDSSRPREGWLHSKWSPLKPLTDEQYKALLQEKLLRLDAEIALLDGDIELLRGAGRSKTEEQQPK